MERKIFARLFLYGSIAVILPFSGCSTWGEVIYKPWAKPDFLSHFCDQKTLKEIGVAYRQQAAAENNEEQLTRLLLTDSAGKAIPATTEDSAIRSLLEQKIQQDFETGKTVIIKGWVLAVTEARQCALLSLPQK